MDADYGQKFEAARVAEMEATIPAPCCDERGLIHDGNMSWVCSCGKLSRLHEERRDIRYHRTQDMYVLRASDGAAIGYFPVRADAEQRMLVDEFVDGVKATVTVR